MEKELEEGSITIAENEYSPDTKDFKKGSELSFRKKMHKERLRKSMMSKPLNSSSINSLDRGSERHTFVMSVNRSSRAEDI